MLILNDSKNGEIVDYIQIVLNLCAKIFVKLGKINGKPAILFIDLKRKKKFDERLRYSDSSYLSDQNKNL